MRIRNRINKIVYLLKPTLSIYLTFSMDSISIKIVFFLITKANFIALSLVLASEWRKDEEKTDLFVTLVQKFLNQIFR